MRLISYCWNSVPAKSALAAMLQQQVEKVWKKFLQLTQDFGKAECQTNLYLSYQRMHDSLDQLKVDVEETLKTIRKSLERIKPLIMSVELLTKYSQMVQVSNEIIVSLQHILQRTFDSFTHLIRFCWIYPRSENFVERERYALSTCDLSIKEWRIMSNKIEKFFEEIKTFH